MSLSVDLIKRIGLFFGLCIVQILILNHIHLFGVATPLLYVYFAVTTRRNTPKWQILLWCFTMGLAIDIFSNTPGLAAGTMTLVGMLQPYLLELFVPRDSFEELRVSASTLGLSKFTIFCSIIILIYVLVFFALEAFTFFDWVHWLICAGSSAALTLILILAIESIRTK